MSRRKLSPKQIAAIELLTEVGTDHLTYEEIAERVGVSSSTLRRWRTENDDFMNEMISQTKRNAVRELPRVMRAVPDIIINSENAAMFRTWMQSIGALTEKVEVSTETKDDVDVESLRKRLFDE